MKWIVVKDVVRGGVTWNRTGTNIRFRVAKASAPKRSPTKEEAKWATLEWHEVVGGPYWHEHQAKHVAGARNDAERDVRGVHSS